MDIDKIVSTSKSVIIIALCVFILYSFYTIPSPIQPYIQRFVNYVIIGAIIGAVLGFIIATRKRWTKQ